ncbi:MAG: TrwC relaxase, partial [Actinomycetota bacterium]|nr:TrwC relaxase [Actinomycetota bacterium]
TTTADQAFAASSADVAAGLDTLLIASTNAQVRQLNLRAQAARLAADAVPAERRVTLADGTTATDGDVIITRRNDRRLALSATDFVANGDRWTVASVRPDGGLDVRHSRSLRRVTLPADYVVEHVQLGYATTVHGAQGQTVDTSHAVLTGTESRQLLYVALTRGRRENHLYLDLTVPGEEAPIYAEAQRPSTAVEVLTRVLEREDSAVSATTARRQERDPVPLLRKACAEYLDALTVAGESILGEDRTAAIAARAEAAVPGISDWPAWPTLHAQLQRVTLNGDEPGQVLRDEAVLVRRDHSRDLAAILANRLEVRDRGSGPLPWLPAVPRQLAEDDFWHRYFDRRAELIHRHAAAVGADASTWTEQNTPAWAVPTLHEPDLTRDLAIWRAAHEVADTDLRPTGPPASGVKNGYQQHRLDRRVSDAGAMPAKADARIAQLGEALHPGITTDPHWPALAQQLYHADREGLHDAQLRHIATARPLPTDQPAAALAYRLVDAIGNRTPTARTPTATARSTDGKTAPPESTVPRRPEPRVRRTYEPPPLSAPPPDYAGIFGSALRPGPRR